MYRSGSLFVQCSKAGLTRWCGKTK